MATDSLVRLKVENTQYDAKIKRAAQGLQHMEEACRKVNGTLAVLEKEEKDFVSSLGKMETVSKDARGRINELTKAFTDLSVQYNRLTDEEKKGDFGKALNKSLGELKGRINNAKAELNNINGEINNNGNLLDNLSSKFGVNIKQLGTWGAALGAGKVAMGVLKDAFFASESNIDEWGRTVESSKAAYNTFVNALNSGDWSNFFSRMNDAIGGARELYNMFDRLGSMKTNNSVLIATLENKLAELRLMKQAGKDVADQIKAVNAQLGKLRGQEVAQGKAANKQGFINVLTNRGVSKADAEVFWNEFLKNGQRAFDYYDERAKKLGKNMQFVTSGGSSVTGATGGGMVWTGSATDEKGYKAYSAFVSAESELKPYIQGFANTIREGTTVMQNEFKYNRWGGVSSSGSGSGGGGGNTKKQVDLSFIFDPKSDFSQKETEKLFASIDAPLGLSAKLGLTADSTSAMALKNAIQGFDTDNSFISTKKRKGFKGDDIDVPFTQTDEWKNVGQGIGEMTNIVGNIENIASAIGVDLGKGFRGILTGLTVITTILETIESIETVGSILGLFHNGGIVHAAQGVFVPGAKNGGRDTVPAMLSPGEVVLNHAQQSNLARQLQSNNSGGGFAGQPFVQGENIVLGVNNHFKRTGQGEIVTTKMLQKYF